jgi:putative oxidoreductase
MYFATLRKNSDWGFLLLRVAVGVIFIYHGSMKWGFWSSTPEGMSGVMVMLFKLLSVVEPVAGAALILGVFTQWAALALGIVMVGAIGMKLTGMMGPQGAAFENWKFDFILLAANVVLLMNGGGSIAVMKTKN